MAGSVDGADERIRHADIVKHIRRGLGRALLARYLFAELARHLGRLIEH